MTKKHCPLGEDCDMTLAWMKGAEDARDKTKARIEALTEQLEAARLDAKAAEAKLATVVALIDEASVEGLDDGYGWKWILVKVSPRGESAKSALPSQN